MRGCLIWRDRAAKPSRGRLCVYATKPIARSPACKLRGTKVITENTNLRRGCRGHGRGCRCVFSSPLFRAHRTRNCAFHRAPLADRPRFSVLAGACQFGTAWVGLRLTHHQHAERATKRTHGRDVRAGMSPPHPKSHSPLLWQPTFHGLVVSSMSHPGGHGALGLWCGCPPRSIRSQQPHPRTSVLGFAVT